MSNSFDLIYGTVSDRRDGTYIGLFTITNVGKYDLSALLGTQVIVQDIPVQIIAGLPSTPQVVLDNLVPARIIAGLDFPLSFQLRDEYSNLIQDCTDFAAFVYISNSGSVVDNQTIKECSLGYINASVSLRKSGSYQIFPYWKKSGLSGGIFGSPFQCTVVAGSADPTKCTAESNFLKIGPKNAVESSTVGIRRSMTIYARDSWGNSIASDPFSTVESFVVYLAAAGQRCSPACPSTCNPLSGLPETEGDICVLSQITNHFDSTYTAEWVVNVADTYLVVASLRGILIQYSPFSFSAVTGQVSLNRSTVYEIPATSTAGQSVTFFAQTLDNWGNNLSVGAQVLPFLLGQGLFS